MYNEQWNMMGRGGYSYGGWEHNLPIGTGAPEWLLALVAIAAPLVLVVIAWSVFWKGLALWHAARRGQYWWFLILLVINTAGILEIIYLFLVAKLKFSQLFSLHSDANHAHH